MTSTLTIFALCLLIVGCSSVDLSNSGTWRASADNGDKPGIGIELTRHARLFTGRMCLLKPDYPDDFKKDLPRRMQVRDATDSMIRFAVDWLPDVHEEMMCA